MNQRNLFTEKNSGTCLEQLQITYKASIIGYMRFGWGPKVAFCFHGYGEDSNSFSFLEKYAGSQYSFFAMDLPFHGQTAWKDGLSCTTGDIINIIGKILTENNKQAGSLSLIGFSLGGRIVLSVYEKIPAQIDKIILLAPDGLRVNPWYWLATQTWIGNKLFAFTMKYPGWFLCLIKLMNKVKLVNPGIFKFANQHIRNATIRQLLYKRWTSLRKLKPDLKEIKSLVNENKTPVRLIYGKHDRIILSRRGEQFIKGIERNASLLIIESGHQVLQEKHIQEILPVLLH